MTLPSKAVLWAASQNPLSLGGTEEPCHSLKVMSRKASGVIPVAEDSPTDRQLSQWGWHGGWLCPGPIFDFWEALAPFSHHGITATGGEWSLGGGQGQGPGGWGREMRRRIRK